MASSSALVPAGEDAGAGPRFHHLLRPIRDLADSWNIDLASELAEYVEELSAIQVSLDGGLTAVNFAEAALLIQGSACVYSKKVEYLYALVYQTLNRVSDKERAPQHPTAVDERGVDVDAPTPRLIEVEFLTLDFLQEGTNIFLSEDDAQGREDEAITTKTPLHVLASADGADSGALHMRGASMHASGVLMLEGSWEGGHPASAHMLNTLLHGMTSASGARLIRMGDAAPDAAPGAEPSPALAGQLTFDRALAAGAAAANGHDDDDDDGFGAAPDFDGMDDGIGYGREHFGLSLDADLAGARQANISAINDGGSAQLGGGLGPATSGPAGQGPASSSAPVGPWTPLDPNDASGVADLRPFRKGKTWKLPPKSAGALAALGAGHKRDQHGRPLLRPASASFASTPALLADGGAHGGADATAHDGTSGCAGDKEARRAERARVARLADDLLSGCACLPAEHGGWSIKCPSPGLYDDFAGALDAEARRRAAVRKAAREELARHTHVPPAADAEADADLDCAAHAGPAPVGGADDAAPLLLGAEGEADDALEAAAPFDDDDEDIGIGGMDGNFDGGQWDGAQPDEPQVRRPQHRTSGWHPRACPLRLRTSFRQSRPACRSRRAHTLLVWRTFAQPQLSRARAPLTAPPCAAVPCRCRRAALRRRSRPGSARAGSRSPPAASASSRSPATRSGCSRTRWTRRPTTAMERSRCTRA